MGPSAQLHGVAVQLPGFAADLHHPHDLAVLVAEKLHYIFTILHAWIWNLGPSDWDIFQNALVDQLLDLVELLRRQRRAAEVEGQLLRPDIRTFLRRFFAHHLM